MSDLTVPLRIRAETSPADPQSMRFVLDRDVQDSAMATFPDAAAAKGAPLAEALFAIAGVKMVDVSGAVVAVVKTDDSDWDTMKRPIANALRSIFALSAAPLGQGAKTFGEARSDADIHLAVQSVLDRRANPAIAVHGGNVSVMDVREGVVSMLMSGGCQGCASSAATLRGGVEKMIRAAVPEVRDIIDVTDHAAGKTPYYSAGLRDQRQPKGGVLRDRIRAHLTSLSAADVPMTYGNLARAMELNLPGSIAKVTQALEATMVEDAENGAPFLASLVVSRVGRGNAAKGFLQQARALGRGPGVGEDDRAYYQREFTGAVAMVTAISRR
jgi:Fe-S cluster biogenesis protein NfuA